MLPRTITKRLKQNPLHSPSTFSKLKDEINCRANWKEGKVGWCQTNTSIPKRPTALTAGTQK